MVNIKGQPHSHGWYSILGYFILRYLEFKLFCKWWGILLVEQVRNEWASVFGGESSSSKRGSDVVLRNIRNTKRGSLGVVPQSILFPCLPSVFYRNVVLWNSWQLCRLFLASTDSSRAILWAFHRLKRGI